MTLMFRIRQNSIRILEDNPLTGHRVYYFGHRLQQIDVFTDLPGVQSIQRLYPCVVQFKTRSVSSSKNGERTSWCPPVATRSSTRLAGPVASALALTRIAVSRTTLIEGCGERSQPHDHIDFARTLQVPKNRDAIEFWHGINIQRMYEEAETVRQELQR